MRANSNYASNEYFLPVMGLVFLRHAYSRYLAVKDGIEANLPTRGGKTQALTKEVFSQQSAIFLQPRAQFDHLVALPDSEDRSKAHSFASTVCQMEFCICLLCYLDPVVAMFICVSISFVNVFLFFFMKDHISST